MCVDTIDKYWALCDRYVAQKRLKLSPLAASFSRGVKSGANYTACCRNAHLKTVFHSDAESWDDASYLQLVDMIKSVSEESVAFILSRLYEKFIDRRGHETTYSGMVRENWVSFMIAEEKMVLTKENLWLSRVKFACLSLNPLKGLTWVVWLSVEPPERLISLVDIFGSIIGEDQAVALMSGFVGPFSIGQDRHEALDEARARKQRLEFDDQTALFSLSYKHYQSSSSEKITYEDWDLIVRAAEVMCKQAGLSKYCLWIDSGLDRSDDCSDILWFTKGILPYLWTPTILLRNHKTSRYSSVWIELEDVLSSSTYNYKILPEKVAVEVKQKGQPVEWALLAVLAARRILNSDTLFNAQKTAFDEIYEWSNSVLARGPCPHINWMEGGVLWIRPRIEKEFTGLEDCINIDRLMPRTLVTSLWDSKRRENLRGSRYLGKYERAPALIRAHGDGSKLDGVEVLGAAYQEDTHNTYVYVRYFGVVDQLEMTRNGSGELRVANVRRCRAGGKELKLKKLQAVQRSLLAELGW